MPGPDSDVLGANRLNEAEIQLLASLQGAELEAAPAGKAALEKRGERYLSFLEDWSGAWSSLTGKGLIEGDEAGYRLTDTGRPLAKACHAERPDSYWYYYQKFYPAAFASAAH